jgi:hypothetical protein
MTSGGHLVGLVRLRTKASEFYWRDWYKRKLVEKPHQISKQQWLLKIDDRIYQKCVSVRISTVKDSNLENCEECIKFCDIKRAVAAWISNYCLSQNIPYTLYSGSGSCITVLGVTFTAEMMLCTVEFFSAEHYSSTIMSSIFWSDAIHSRHVYIRPTSVFSSLAAFLTPQISRLIWQIGNYSKVKVKLSLCLTN